MCCDRLEYAPRIQDTGLLSHLDSDLVPSLTLGAQDAFPLQVFCIGLYWTSPPSFNLCTAPTNAGLFRPTNT